jgi:plasmid stabilization system protein ParE
MALQVIWTQEAERQFSEILKYWIERNGSNSYAIKLNRIVGKSLSILTRYPESGRITEKEGVGVKFLKNYFIYY